MPGSVPNESYEARERALLDPSAAHNELCIPRGLSLKEVQRRYVADALQTVEQNKSRAAQQLGVSRNTITRLLRQGD